MSQEADQINFKDAVPGVVNSPSKMLKKRDLGIKVRIKFRKYGAVRFIGHLDVMRYFQKLIRRAELDIAYSEGFHPHQIMSFANPLGVGLFSNGEYVDITLNSAAGSADIVKALNAVTVEGIDIVSARRLPVDAGNAMASICFADYSINFRPGKCPLTEEELLKLVNDFYLQDKIIVEKKTKKGSKTLNLKESIHELSINNSVIFMRVTAGSALNIRPEMVMDAIFNHAGIDLEPFSYQITRQEMYDDTMTSLENKGTEF